MSECTGEECFAQDYYCVPLSDGRWGYNLYWFDCIKQGFAGCKNGACTNDIAQQQVSCTDREKNQNEVDVDCGGVCQKCGIGKRCSSNSDCESNWCRDTVCSGTASTCSDSIKNQDESDVDCGGMCQKCSIGKKCIASTDCKSGRCDGSICKEAIKIESYCLDEDDGNANTNAKLKFGYYEYDGRWNEGYVAEDCVAGDSIVQSCTPTTQGCSVREAVCDTSSSSGYTFEKIPCTNGCSNGACLGTIIVTTDDSSGRQATAVPVEEAQPVQVQADSRHITVRTDDNANQATPVQVEEDQPVVVQAETSARGENVVLQEEDETQFQLPNPEREGWASRAWNSFRNIFRGSENGEGTTAVVGCDNLCGQIRTVRESLAQRIIDLENAVYNLRQQEIKRIAQQEIKNQLSGFLASCEFSRTGSQQNFRNNYRNCKRFCETSGRICLNTIGYYIDEREPYPISDTLGCSYEGGVSYNRVDCICCSFPS